MSKVVTENGRLYELSRNDRKFLKQYSFKDTEEIYTNGAELIPVFRVMQAIEHYIKE